MANARDPQTVEQRRQMISEAAYYRAERRGFEGGDPAADWFDAEAEIDQRDEALGMDSKAVLEQRLEAQLSEWDTQIDELLIQAEHASGALRAEYDTQLNALAKKRMLATAELVQLHHRTEGAWKDLREGLARAWGDLGEALERVVKNLAARKEQ